LGVNSVFLREWGILNI